MSHETEDTNREKTSTSKGGLAATGGRRAPLISHEISWPFTSLELANMLRLQIDYIVWSHVLGGD